MPSLKVAKLGSRKKKKRRRKPAGQPKRFASAFLHYSSVRRPQVKAQSPHLQHIEVTKQLGTEWNGMLAEAKEPYQEIERKERAEWESAVLQYKLKQHGAGSETASAAVKRGADTREVLGTSPEAIGELMPPDANDGMAGGGKEGEEEEEEEEEEAEPEEEEEEEPGGEEASMGEQDESNDTRSTTADGQGVEMTLEMEGRHGGEEANSMTVDHE